MFNLIGTNTDLTNLNLEHIQGKQHYTGVLMNMTLTFEVTVTNITSIISISNRRTTVTFKVKYMFLLFLIINPPPYVLSPILALFVILSCQISS